MGRIEGSGGNRRRRKDGVRARWKLCGAEEREAGVKETLVWVGDGDESLDD